MNISSSAYRNYITNHAAIETAMSRATDTENPDPITLEDLSKLSRSQLLPDNERKQLYQRLNQIGSRQIGVEIRINGNDAEQVKKIMSDIGAAVAKETIEQKPSQPEVIDPVYFGARTLTGGALGAASGGAIGMLISSLSKASGNPVIENIIGICALAGFGVGGMAGAGIIGEIEVDAQKGKISSVKSKIRPMPANQRFGYF